MNLFEKSFGKTLPKEFSWINEPGQWGFDDSGKLLVTAPSKADYFRHPAGLVINDSAPFLYSSFKGDFTISTRVEAEMIDEADSACLMLMLDEKNWAKICFENCYKSPSIVSVVTKNMSDDCNSDKVSIKNPYLRVTRAGNSVAFHYSLDGEFWKMVRYFCFENMPAEVKVGAVAQSPVGNGCKVSFDFLKYSPEPVKNIRSGE
jgi:uncharacterized protein